MAPSASSPRQYELVLFGATGYTGKLTAEHITTSLPTDLKWAVAGRSQKKLAALVDEIKALNPDRIQPAIEIAELEPAELDALTKKTKVLISVVGPYCLYGTPVVEACARNGTHYLDVTGETPWVKSIIDKYHAAAQASGAIIIPQIGFESAPADVVSWALVDHLRQKLDLPTEEVVFSTHKVKGAPSGGTSATVLSILDVFSLAQVAASMKPWALSPVPGPRYPRGASRLTGLRHNALLGPGVLATTFTGSTDRSIVHRSWGLLGGASKAGYGARFHFSPYLRVANPLIGIAVHVAVLVGSILLALPPVRWLLRKIIYAPGAGPTKEDTSKEFCEFRAVATADQPGVKTPRQAQARFRYEGGIYYLTGVFLAEAALVLLRGYEKDVRAKQLGGGVLTPATLGQPFVQRLRASGVTLDVNLVEQ